MQSKNTILGIIGIILLVIGCLWALIWTEATTTAIVFLVLGGASVLTYIGMNISFLTKKLTGRYAKAGANMAVSVVIFGAIVVFLYLLLFKYSKRIDMTESKKFSLATQTTQLLKGMDEELDFLFMQNPQNPGGNQRANELMDLYQHYTDKINVRSVDPQKEPEVVKELAPVTYGAIYIQKGDQKEKVSPVDENTLTNGLLKILKGGDRTVYFTVGHDEPTLEDNQRDGLLGMKQILEEEGYQTKELQLYTMDSVPEDCIALVITGPKKPFLEPEITALKNYIDQGGKLFLMLDPETQSGLEAFMSENYGIEFGNDWVLENNPLMRLFGGSPQAPLIATVEPHPIVSAFEQSPPPISFPLVQSLQLQSPLPNEFTGTEIIKTSDKSWAEKDLAGTRSSGAAQLDPTDVPGPITIAVALTKTIENGTGEDAAEEEPTDDNVEKLDVKPEIRMAVFGDSDFARNKNYQTSLDLFVNTINWLSQQEDMISIRPKDDSGQPIMLNDVDARLVFYSSLVILPGCIAIFGALVCVMKKVRG